MTRSERLEVVAAVLLATATIATAWAAYQSRQWTGEQAHGYSVGTASRIAENRSAALANRQVQIDGAVLRGDQHETPEHPGPARDTRPRMRRLIGTLVWTATFPVQLTPSPG